MTCLAGAMMACSALVDVDPDRLGDTTAADLGHVDLGHVDLAHDLSPPTCAEGCDDGIDCTRDECVDGACRNSPDGAQCDGSERCDPAEGCIPNRCATDAECNDAVDCTVDRCDEDGCSHTPSDRLCNDGFCFVGGMCTLSGCTAGTARDCDDDDPCTADRCDPDGAACVNAPVDADGDQAPAMFVGDTICAGGTDCDDQDPARSPNAPEVCDDIDQDCDTRIDEDLPNCAPAGGESCDDVRLLTLDAAGRAEAHGELGAYAADYESSCGSSSSDGSDAIFAVDVFGVVDVEIDTIDSVADTILAVGLRCGAFRLGGRGCHDDIDISEDITASRIWVHRFGQLLRTQRLFIMVKGYSRSETDGFELHVRVSPAAPDTCPSPLDIGDGGAVVGFVSGSRFLSGTCQSERDRFAAEAQFRISPQQERLVVNAWSEDFPPDLYATRTCGREEIVCADNDDRADVLRQTSLDERLDPLMSPTFLVIDGASSGDVYTLDYVR